MEPQQQQQEDEAPPSPLLSALQRLDDAAWRSVLLPLLTRHAGSLALTCRVLRVLCQRTHPRLRFRGQRMQDAALALVPERFPACTDVHLIVHTDEDAVDALPALLPALARLPALTRLTLHLDTSITANNSSMALMLHLLRVQLPRLHALALHPRTSSWSSNAHIWRALGSMAQLRSLQLVLQGSADDSLQHMTALSGLSGLQSFDVQRFSSTTCPQHHGYLASLGALTRLAVPLISVDGLAAIGACSNLRDMRLRGPSSHTAPQLDDAACAGLQRLEQLTYLALFDVGGTDSPAFALALGSMRQLEELEVPVTSHATLAALVGLTKLTRLASNWAPGGEAAAAGVQPTAAAVCVSVREVDLRGAGIPWSAFPGATSIKQYGSWAPAEFIAISTHCRQLAALKYAMLGGCMLLASAPAAERTAGICSLSALTALTSLAWRANDNVELAALAMLGNLRALDVTCMSECTLAGAQALATARQLSSVKLDVRALRVMPAARDVVALLVSFRHLQRLCIRSNHQQRGVFEQRLADAQAAGVGLPAKVVFGLFG